MTAPTAPGLYDTCRATVDAMAHTGAGVDELERAIEVFPIGRDEQSALWLWATAPPPANACCLSEQWEPGGSC